MNEYLLGQTVRLNGRLLNELDQPIDATSVVCKVLGPTDAQSQNVNVSTISTGVFYSLVTPDEAGVWRYRFESTVGTNAAVEGEFLVVAKSVT